MKKKKLKKQLIFNIINTALLLFFVVFYSYRLIHYYNIENGNKGDTLIPLADELVKHVSYVDLDNGLVEYENDGYYYKGNTKNNYVYYSGRLWRIFKITKENHLKLVLNDSETIFYQTKSTEYNSSSLRNYLELVNDVPYSGTYFKTLNKPYEMLSTTELCLDMVDDMGDITCHDKYSDDYITLMSLYDYKNVGGANSYLNNESNFWLSTTNADGMYWYVASDGGIKLQESDSATYGIRPVITLKNMTLLRGGNGTKANPYIVEEESVKTLRDASVSKYVSYSDYVWRIINKEEDKVYLALDGYVKVDDSDIEIAYGSNNSYSNNKNTIGNYLNNTFYKSLKNTDYVVKSSWYYGKYNEYNNFDYSKTFSTKYDNYIGLLKVGDLYVNEYSNTFILTRPYGASNLIYSINDKGNYFINFTTSKLKVRPALYLKGDLNVLSGDGSKDNPYEIGVIEWKKK